MSIDPTQHSAVIAFEDGRQLSVTFPEHANIEVVEPCTLGTMGGSLEDLKVGYWVQAELNEGGHACSCSSLVSLS